jgi:hypothetical protein
MYGGNFVESWKKEKFPFAFIVEAFSERNFLTADKDFNVAANSKSVRAKMIVISVILFDQHLRQLRIN